MPESQPTLNAPIQGDLPADFPAFPIFNNGCAYQPLDTFKFPWENPYPFPEGMSEKEVYRYVHSQDKDAIVPHFSPFIGVNPKGHITEENPPVQMLGVVGDYDARLTEHEFAAGLALDLKSKPYPPFAVNRTFSGGVRAVWVFERPINVCVELWDSIADKLMTELKVNQYWKSLDAKPITRKSQTCVCGQNWTLLKYRIPAIKLHEWVFEASKNRRVFSGLSIPFDKINEEYRRRVAAGDFWDIGSKELAPGVRCQRFWARREGRGTHLDTSVVHETGIQCNTGPHPWRSWTDIFGKEFTAEFRTRALNEALTNIWYATGTGEYFTRTRGGRWKSTEAAMVKLLLRQMGFSDQKQKGAATSPLEDILVEIDQNDARHVVAAVPFALNKNEVVDWNDKRYLNTSTTRLLEPAANVGEFPWIKSYLHRLIPDEFEREHFFAWVRHWYKLTRAGKYGRGQAIFLCGPTGTGKTLLSNQLLARIFGGHVPTTKVALGETGFNAELLEKALWTIDDADTFGTGSREHKKLSNYIKAAIANPAMEFEKKYGFHENLPFLGRIFVTLNDDEQSVSLLPHLTSSTEDKMNFYRSGVERTEDFDEDVLAAELPYFVRWLVDTDHDPRVKRNARYGIAAYQNRGLAERANQSTRATMLVYVLHKLLGMKLMSYLDTKQYRGQLSGEAARSVVDKWEARFRVSTLADEILANPNIKEKLGGERTNSRTFWREIAEKVQKDCHWLQHSTSQNAAHLTIVGKEIPTFVIDEMLS